MRGRAPVVVRVVAFTFESVMVCRLGREQHVGEKSVETVSRTSRPVLDIITDGGLQALHKLVRRRAQLFWGHGDMLYGRRARLYWGHVIGTISNKLSKGKRLTLIQEVSKYISGRRGI